MIALQTSFDLAKNILYPYLDYAIDTNVLYCLFFSAATKLATMVILINAGLL